MPNASEARKASESQHNDQHEAREGSRPRTFAGQSEQEARNKAAVSIAQTFRLPSLAPNGVTYATTIEREIQDVMTAIRMHTTLEGAGLALQGNAERHFRTQAEMEKLFADLAGQLTDGKSLAPPLQAERWLAPVFNYIPAQDQSAQDRRVKEAMPTPAPASAVPANDVASTELAAHPPGCNCAVHLAYRKKAARAG